MNTKNNKQKNSAQPEQKEAGWFAGYAYFLTIDFKKALIELVG